MPGLLDIIGQALSMPTQLAQQKANLQQTQLGNTGGLMSTGLMGQALQNYYGSLPPAVVQSLQKLGIAPTQQAPPQSTGQSLFTGAQQMVNAAQPHGAALNAAPPQPQTTQSPTGPVTTFPLMSPPAQQGAPPAQIPAPSGGLLPPQQPPQQGQPQQGLLPPQSQQQQLTPMQEYQQGMGLVSNPASQYLPFLKSRGQAMMDEAKLRLSTDPTYLTQQAVAKAQLTQDQYMVDHAQNAAQRQAAQTKRDTDAGQLRISNNTGAVTSIGIPQPNFSTTNPEQGTLTTQNGQTLLSGATGTRAAIAAAQAQGQEAGRAPYDMEEVTDGSGNKYLVPKAQLLAPGTPGGARPAGAPAAPALAGLGPQAQAGLQGRGTQSADYVTTLQKAADDATTSNYSLDNVVQSARGATLGPGAPAREFVEKGFTALAQTLDPTFKPPAELGNYQELAKYGNQLGFASARTMGSREAAQIVNMAIASNPNKELTPQAFGWIANSMKAMNNYVIAKNEAVQGADKQTPGAAQQAAATWNAKVSPQAWDLSLDPGMAAELAPKLGADKIASSLPFMSSPDAVAAFRNIPASMRATVLAKLPPQAKQELAQGLRQ